MARQVVGRVTRTVRQGAHVVLGLVVASTIWAAPAAAEPAAAETPAAEPVVSAAPSATPTPTLSQAPSAAPHGRPAAKPAAKPAASSPRKQKRSAQDAGQTCGGAVALGTVVSCPLIDPGQRHTYSVTTTRAGEELRIRLVVDTATGWGGDTYVSMTAADGSTVCHLYGNDECTVPTAGTYTLTVMRDAGSEDGPTGYRLGAQSYSNPQNCTALPDEAFAFPVKDREGAIPAATAGLCFSFRQPTGAMLRLALTMNDSVRGHIVDAGGSVLCGLDGDRECRLGGSGPYRMVFTSQSYREGSYRLWAVRVSDPQGCATVSPAAFGGPGDAAGAITVEPGVVGCQTLATTAGPHLLAFGPEAYFDFELRDPAGRQVCSGSDRSTADCGLPEAGTYALITKNNTSDPRRVAVAAYPLTSTKGCAGPISTSWNTPGVPVRMSSALQVDCHLLDATTGDRVRADAPNGWITDASGERICQQSDDEGQEGCVLTGAGPYRMLSAGYWYADSEPFTYGVAAVKLNGHEGCETVPLGRYNAPPAGPRSSNKCRVLTVPAPGNYQLAPVDERNEHAYGQVYDSAGRRVCWSSMSCSFDKAGTYTLVVPEGGPYATVFLGAASGGCVTASDQPLTAPQAGEFTVAGEYDCLQLPTPQGAGLAMVRPQDSTGTGYPEMAVYDATNAYQCDIDGLRDRTCSLDGTAPFRAILHLDSDTDDVAGPYRLGFVRTDSVSGCPVLPASAFGGTASASLPLGDAAFVGCLTIPAGQHASTEAFTLRRTAGAGLARVSVFQPDGRRACTRSRTDAATMICDLGAGTVTVLVEGTAAPGTYAFARHDVTGTAAGCRVVTDTTVGAPAIPATLASAGDVHCYRVTAAQGDRLAVDSRDPAKRTRAVVLDAAGADQGCAGLVSGCSVTGRAAYQVIVFQNGSGATPYELDVWKVWANGKPPAECTVVPSVAYGFGPYTGTLTGTKPAACFTATRSMYDDMPIDVTNPADPDDGYFWDAGVYTVTGTGMQSCAIGDGGFHCWYQGSQRTETAVYLLTNGQRLEPHPYRIVGDCRRPLCGGSTFAVTAVTPETVTAGAKRTVTVTGSSLHLQDTVQVTPASGPALTASVRTVSADRRTMTAEVDLTSAAPGAATVTVRPYASTQEPVTLTGALTVTAAALRSTAAPSISGTAAVGATVKAAPGSWTPAATSYAYRWAANGVTIPGATKASLTITAGLLGKRLTVTVTATRAGHPSGSATSAASAAIAKGKAPSASATPKVTGTAKVGRTVKATAGTWSPKVDSYRYEWRLNGTVVRGASGSSLKLTSAMRDKKLTVTVIARKNGYADGRATSAKVTVRR